MKYRDPAEIVTKMVQIYPLDTRIVAIFALLLLSLSLSFPLLVVTISALLVYLYERLLGYTLDLDAYLIALACYALWSLARW